MRYTTMVVTVGDHDTSESLDQIRDQVAAGVESAGFASVSVEIQAAGA